jgi:folate-binding protein YgfZ
VSLSAQHEAALAVFAEVAGTRVVTHYGNDAETAAAHEFTAARQGSGLCDLSSLRGRLVVSGPVRQKFLNGVLSNDVAKLSPGQGCLAALLDPRGHVLALLRVLAADDAVILETDSARLAFLEERLAHYRVAAPVRLAADRPVVLGLLGRDTATTLGRAGLPSPSAPEAHVVAQHAGHEVRVVRATDLPAGAFVLHCPEAAAPSVWTALLEAGAVPIGRHALDALRVAAGRPFYGADISEDNLLHETGLVKELHSPTKGCYVGQEMVARLSARGENVNRALRGLKLAADTTAGAEITAEGRKVGHVTTAARSPRIGPIALGYVARSHFAPGTVVDVGGAPALVRALPIEE